MLYNEVLTKISKSILKEFFTKLFMCLQTNQKIKNVKIVDIKKFFVMDEI